MTAGARYEIVVDGKPRSYRDQEEAAREAATLPQEPSSLARPVELRDLHTGTSTPIKHPLDR